MGFSNLIFDHWQQKRRIFFSKFPRFPQRRIMNSHPPILMLDMVITIGLGFVWFACACIATIHVAHHRSGRRLASWLTGIWLLPILGALCAIIVVRPAPAEQ